MLTATCARHYRLRDKREPLRRIDRRPQGKRRGHRCREVDRGSHPVSQPESVSVCPRAENPGIHPEDQRPNAVGVKPLFAAEIEYRAKSRRASRGVRPSRASGRTGYAQSGNARRRRPRYRGDLVHLSRTPAARRRRTVIAIWIRRYEDNGAGRGPGWLRPAACDQVGQSARILILQTGPARLPPAFPRRVGLYHQR